MGSFASQRPILLSEGFGELGIQCGVRGGLAFMAEVVDLRGRCRG